MPDKSERKRKLSAIKRFSREIRRVLVDVWDPICVRDGLGPMNDEYDRCVDHVAGLLIHGATDDEIAEYLYRQASEDMGLAYKKEETADTIAALREIPPTNYFPYRVDIAHPKEERLTNSNRNALGFVDAAAEHLTPLLASRHFRCSEAGPNHVRYSSDRVTLEAWHEIDSFEIIVCFALNHDALRKISLMDILAVQLGEEKARDGWFQASTRTATEHSIQRIAHLISRYGQQILSGDENKFAEVEAHARARDSAYTKLIVQKPIRDSALEAWQRNDFSAVKKLYESIETDLDDVERGKLAYARKRVG